MLAVLEAPWVGDAEDEMRFLLGLIIGMLVGFGVTTVIANNQQHHQHEH